MAPDPEDERLHKQSGDLDAHFSANLVTLRRVLSVRDAGEDRPRDY